MIDYVHVMPVNDSAPHRDEPECWCGPTPDPEEPLVLVHHSADGRELAEGCTIVALYPDKRVVIRALAIDKVVEGYITGRVLIPLRIPRPEAVW